MTTDVVGFVGIGLMGEPMAINLLSAGTPLVVWNRTPEKCDTVRVLGARVASSPAELFAEAETAILMLAHEGAVDAVLGRGTEVFASTVAGHTLVQMSTVSADYSRNLDAAVRAAGGSYVEAPVSGSRKSAEGGQLVVMLAGQHPSVEAVRPLMDPMCRETVYCGDIPNALLMKFATNMVLLPLIASLAEAFHFAEHNGLDTRQFAAVINGGQMASDIARIKGEKLAAGDFTPQAAISDALKNNRFACAAARESKLAAPLLDLCEELYSEAESMGYPRADVTSVVKAIEERTRNLR